MVVELSQDGSFERVDAQRVATWLAAAGHDPAAVEKQYGEAYAVLTRYPIPFRYGIDEQAKFIASLARYTSAVRESQKLVTAARRKFGSRDASVTSNSVDVWKDRVAPEDHRMFAAVQSVLRDRDQVLSVLSVVNGVIAANELVRTPQEWHGLFLQLLAEHGLDPNSGSIDRTLTPEQFLDEYVANAKLPLDPGADATFFTKEAAVEGGYKHGGLSHTLQWLIVASAVEAGRLPDLQWPAGPGAKRLGDVFKKTAQPRGELPHLSPWSTMVDFNPGRGACYDATMPEGLTYWVYQGFPAIRALEDQIQEELLRQLKEQGKTTYNWIPPAN